MPRAHDALCSIGATDPMRTAVGVSESTMQKLGASENEAPSNHGEDMEDKLISRPSIITYGARLALCRESLPCTQSYVCGRAQG